MHPLTPGEEVSSGNVDINVTIDNVSVVTESFDLCAIIPEVNLMCPLAKGGHIAAITVDLPEDIPGVS